MSCARRRCGTRRIDWYVVRDLPGWNTSSRTANTGSRANQRRLRLEAIPPVSRAEGGGNAASRLTSMAYRAGGRLTLGSDFPVESIDPLKGFYAAVTRLDEDGNSPMGKNGW